MEILITPKMDESRAAYLSKQAQKIEWAIDPEHQVQAKPIGQSGALEQAGAMLWQASGLDAQAVRQAIETAKNRDELLRIVIAGEQYQHLPWELLYHEHPELGFVTCHSRCSLIRRISTEEKTAPAPRARPFRILLFVASPEGLDPEKARLDYEKEEELLFTALDEPLSRKQIALDVAEDGCFETLIRCLETTVYHAVILSMHGTEAKNGKGSREWGLLFEEPDTYAKAPVPGSALAAAIEALPKGHSPGLMVLSACRSAKTEDSSESLSGVAVQMHKSGAARVLGMRLSVFDKAASVFNAELFRRLALGETLGRSLSLARKELAKDEFLHAYAQWTLPVLLDRTPDLPLMDLAAPGETEERAPLPTVLDGDRTVFFPQRAAFIGRRQEIRKYRRDFLDGKTRCLLFTGTGGIGKTTLAAWFARTFAEKNDNARILGFTAPFDLSTLYEPLRQQAFDGEEEESLWKVAKEETDGKERVRRMLLSLAKRKHRPLVVLLDNLESLQHTGTLQLAEESGLWLLKTVCELPHPARILLTGRYAIPQLPGQTVTVCPMNQAPYADILRRMNRLELAFADETEEDTRTKRKVYDILGGNHRAVEWMAQLMNDADAKAAELIAAMENLNAPPDTPEEQTDTVLQAMRHNLLFDTIRKQLTPAQDRLLCAAALYRIPVNEDGLTAIEEKPEMLTENRNRLLDYSLLEKAWNPVIKMDYFLVPPVVKSLLRHGFHEQELKDLHEKMGWYHRYQAQHISKLMQDAIEAVYHFRLAEKHVEADELAEYVTGFYYQISSFAEANALVKEIVERKEPPAPCWAWNRYAQCQQIFGFLDDALKIFEQALSIVPNKESEGTTLNNISAIYSACGDYDIALKYLEQSLVIMREIGDNSGQGITLNNISMIYSACGDYDIALKYLEQSLVIQREIGDKSGEGTTLNNIGQIYSACGDYDNVLKYLEQSLAIIREIGNRKNEAGSLSNISQIYSARGDYDTALKYLEQSLGIIREIGDKSGEGTTLNNIGQIYSARGDYDTALKYLEQTLEIDREIGDKYGQGITLNNISLIYSARGNYDTALKYLEQSLGIRREIGDKSGIANTLHNMAGIAIQSKEMEKFFCYCFEALSLAAETGNAQAIFNVGRDFGCVLSVTGNKEQGRQLLSLAIQVGRQAGFPDVQEVEAFLHQLDAPPPQENRPGLLKSLWNKVRGKV